MIEEAAELEAVYGGDTMPRGLLGLALVLAEVDNPFPRMGDAMDLSKEKTFFKTRVIDYQNGGSLASD